ncbi:hypothetical protein A6A11_07615 [Bisgaardia hudsonensis]|nr:hypothetical protein A6A11_07615 [Bisgaardia hudsonensis]
MEKGAIFSECGNYRYLLWRIWDIDKPNVMFIGLNPSTADETIDDNTITRCINFAKQAGFGGVYMVNLFAYRSTDKSVLYQMNDPIGHDNDKYINSVLDKVDKVVACWGNDGQYLDRSQHIYNLIPDLYCLKVNKNGEPAHPLYLSSTLNFRKYTRREKC